MSPMPSKPIPDSFSNSFEQLRLFDAELLKSKQLPGFHHETHCHQQGKKLIAGVDEAGRGPLAGPVVAAAVILNPDDIPEGLNDSKKMNEGKREALFDAILASSHVSFSSIAASHIDTTNIRQATLKAMVIAAYGLPKTADHILIDGRDVPLPLNGKATALVKGDAISVSIAAASIIAKVMRDRIMKCASLTYSQYGFENHKGYGSKMHLEAIEKFGPCPLHRMSFAPMKYL